VRSIAQGSWEALVIVLEQRGIIDLLLEAMRAMSKANVIQVDLGMRFGQISAVEWQPENAHFQSSLGQQHAVLERPELLGSKLDGAIAHWSWLAVIGDDHAAHAFGKECRAERRWQAVDTGATDGWDTEVARVVGGQRHERFELAALGQHDHVRIANVIPAEGVDCATLARRSRQGARLGTSAELACAQIGNLTFGDGREEQCAAEVPVRAQHALWIDDE
jgi:hypothetical protein